MPSAYLAYPTTIGMGTNVAVKTNAPTHCTHGHRQYRHTTRTAEIAEFADDGAIAEACAVVAHASPCPGDEDWSW